VEKQGFAYSCLCGNFVHGAFLVAVLREHPIACIDYGKLLFLGQGKEFIVHFLPPDCIGQ